MDLTLSGDQTAIVELAARILGDRSTPEALAEAEAGGDRFDAGLWDLLARPTSSASACPSSRGAAATASSRPPCCARRWGGPPPQCRRRLDRHRGAYIGASGTAVVAEQIPFALSGGVIGLALIIIGSALVIRFSLARLFRIWLARITYEHQVPDRSHRRGPGPDRGGPGRWRGAPASPGPGRADGTVPPAPAGAGAEVRRVEPVER